MKSKSIECVSDRGADTGSWQIDPAALRSSGRATLYPAASHQALKKCNIFIRFDSFQRICRYCCRFHLKCGRH
jgi:hypothetical protein